MSRREVEGDSLKPPTPENTLNNPLLASLSQALLRLPSFLDQHIFNRRTAVSRHQHWNVGRYFDLIQDERYQNWGTMRHLLWQDFLTFTDEAIVPRYKTGPYLFTPKGMPESYQDDSKTYSQSFVEQQKKHASRAEIEGQKWQQLEKWLQAAETEQVPLGQTFIWFSPRGSKEEGYIGKEPKNPNLISVYVKYEHGVEMHQFKTWSNLEQMKQTIEDLDFKLADMWLDESHNCIESSGVCPATIPLSEIETIIYASESSAPDWDEEPWPVTKDDLPVVDLDAFNDFREQVFDVYIEFLLKYLFESFKQKKTKKNSKKLVSLLDTFFSIATKTLEGWVYFNDQRPDKSSTYESELTSSVKSDDQAELKQSLELAGTHNVGVLLNLFFTKLELLTFDAESFSEADVLSIKMLSKQLMLNIPMRLFSLGQCVGLALPSMVGSTLVRFNGGFLPESIAVKEGWLEGRPDICARGAACISPPKFWGKPQQLGPCNWCWSCDGRFGHLRELSKIDYRLFKPKTTPSHLEMGSYANKYLSTFSQDTVKAPSSVTLTQFLAGDYAAA